MALVGTKKSGNNLTKVARSDISTPTVHFVWRIFIEMTIFGTRIHQNPDEQLSASIWRNFSATQDLTTRIVVSSSGDDLRFDTTDNRLIVRSSSIADFRFLTDSEINKKEKLINGKWHHFLVTQKKSNQFMRISRIIN